MRNKSVGSRDIDCQTTLVYTPILLAQSAADPVCSVLFTWLHDAVQLLAQFQRHIPQYSSHPNRTQIRFVATLSRGGY